MKVLNYWNGRPIEELDRDELLEVIEHLATHYGRTTSPEFIEAYAIGSAEVLRRTH